MQRFVSRRIIKVPRYKIISIKIICFIIIIFIIYFGISFLISKDNSKLLALISNNSFGNNIQSSNIYNKDILFYKNSFGLIPDSKNVNYSNNNIHNLVASKPLLYIYNTFQTTTYKSTNTNDYNVNSIVTSTNLILSEYLKKEGIKSIVELTSIDSLMKEKNYSNNYLASKELLTTALKKNPTLNYFFDLQISEDDYETTTYETDNKKNYAKIRFIIGTNYETYKENLEFATNLNTKLVIKNPNLSRGISLEGGTNNDGIYNQNLNPHIILIEIGGKENTIEEVNRTLKVFSSAIKEAINEKEKE